MKLCLCVRNFVIHMNCCGQNLQSCVEMPVVVEEEDGARYEDEESQEETVNANSLLSEITLTVKAFP